MVFEDQGQNSLRKYGISASITEIIQNGAQRIKLAATIVRVNFTVATLFWSKFALVVDLLERVWANKVFSFEGDVGKITGWEIIGTLSLLEVIEAALLAFLSEFTEPYLKEPALGSENFVDAVL